MLEENVPQIVTLDDLQDYRARAIAHRHELGVMEILPGYLELAGEVRANGGYTKVSIGGPNAPLDIPAGLIRKLACGAILSYEITKRPAIQFPIAKRLVVVGQEVLLLELSGSFNRTDPVDVYARKGQCYEQLISVLCEHQREHIDRLLERRLL